MLKELLQNRRMLVLFSLMFSIVSLLNVNYYLLRSARYALTVVDLGKGASSLPFFELCGTLPCAILMVFLLTRLLNRFSIHKVFHLMLAFFTLFFLLFALGVYPSLSLFQRSVGSWEWLAGHSMIAHALPQALSMLFFVMAELWKIALLTVLFWGVINQYIPLTEAKKFYAPLMLGGSIGAILSGPLINFCNSEFIYSGSWSHSLTSMMVAVALLSVITAWLYIKFAALLQNHPPIQQNNSEDNNQGLSLGESVRACLKSPYLLLLAWITIADYVAYTLGEVIFFDIAKLKYPEPRDYSDFIGQIGLWNGVLTAISAVVITPLLLKKCQWVVSSLITPVCLVITEGLFFFTLWSSSPRLSVDLLIVLGTLFFCIVRAAKCTLFDTSKEISFLLLPPLQKMQGKLVIDGICSRLGKGGASLLSIVLIQVCGGVLASALLSGWIALGIGVSCVFSTLKLGLLVNRKSVALK